jgi:hypothetical protein
MVEPVFGRWGPTEVMERVLDGTWAEVVDGMGLIEPESISFSGTSAAISGLGSVEFTAITSLSLNGIFSSEYDNYLVVSRYVGSLNQQNFLARLRAASTDASGTNYTRQVLYASSTSAVGLRSTSQTSAFVAHADSQHRSGLTLNLYGPHLAQPTAMRSFTVSGDAGAYVWDEACTHSLSTAYDGITLYPSSGTLTGRVAVYVMVK